MKADYKNWVPKGMVVGYFAGFCFAFALALTFGAVALAFGAVWQIALFAVFTVLAALLAFISVYMLAWHRAFDYNGKRKLSKQIVEGTAQRVELKEGGICLDVGCGSGALTIAVAKCNPKAKVVGCDRWGKDYASFSMNLCYKNAEAEGVTNVSFERGDATALPYADEAFDAVCSNYVYHNIPTRDRQAILLETFRVLKKGGTFAIHDLFTKQKYGDMTAFVQKLKELGFEKVELIDTTKGMFMSPKEAKWLVLSGSALLVGKK